jgi:hypothetical protein
MKASSFVAAALYGAKHDIECHVFSGADDFLQFEDGAHPVGYSVGWRHSRR